MGEVKCKKKVCPVINEKITSRECGEKRGSHYNCPAECDRNPWSVQNYEKAMEIHDRMLAIASPRMLDEECERNGFSVRPPPGGSGGELELLAFFFQRFFREKDEAGQTFFERWEAVGWKGLNNDQQVLFRCHSNFYPAIIEVQQVLDDHRMMVINRLNPKAEPFLLVDYSLGARACRFTVLLGVLLKLPHYHRLHGAAVEMKPVTDLLPEEVLDVAIVHLKGPKKGANRDDWISFHLQKIQECLTAVALSRREQILRSVDVAECHSVYRLINCSEEEFISAMSAHAETDDEEACEDDYICSWLWKSDKKLFGSKGDAVLGFVHLNDAGHVVLEASSAKRDKTLKKKFESLMDRCVEFQGSQVRDHAQQMLQRSGSSYDAALVPHKLLGNPQKFELSCTRFAGAPSASDSIDGAFKEFDRTYPDIPVPALNNKTPRQATESPVLRPVLIELMKQQVLLRDESNLKSGTCVDINGLIEELGLDEINFPPPPRVLQQRALKDFSSEGGDEELYDEAPFFFLITESIIEDVEHLLQKFPPGCVSGKVGSSCPDVKEFLEVFCSEHFTASAAVFDDVWDLAVRTVCMFFDPSSSDLPEMFTKDLHLRAKELLPIFYLDEDVSCERCWQPVLLKYVSNELNPLFDMSKQKSEYILLLTFFCALIDELDFALFMSHIKPE